MNHDKCGAIFFGVVILLLLIGGLTKSKEDTNQQRMQLYNAGVTEMYEKGELSNAYE